MNPFSCRQKRFQNQSSEAAIFKPLTLSHSTAEIVGNRMNDIMKVLTIFAAIFIPLTFIAGIYGTNFEYLPELKFKYSYFIFWGVMLAVAAVMLIFFRKKKWL